MNLVLVRHGESVWNKENRFTGWTDVPLTDTGVKEALAAGEKIASLDIHFDIAYTSYLKRAQDTLKYIMERVEIPRIVEDYHLNERHYGALQGLNKDEMRSKYGDEQVQIWRRSFDVRPPLLTKDDDRFPGFDPKYADIDQSKLPLGESLKDTLNRTLGIMDEIKEEIKDGKNVLIVAHGNSLRAIVKDLEHTSDEDIVNLEIPTGVPIVYTLDRDLNILDKRVL